MQTLLFEKRCTWCGETKPVSEFHRKNNAYDGLNCHCKKCANAKRRVHYAQNRAAINAAERKRRAPGTKHHRRAREANRRWFRSLRDRVLDAYGAICECCGESNRALLTLDHCNSDGAAHRRSLKNGRTTSTIYQWAEKNGFPEILRVMCWNCNNGAYRNRDNQGTCPHQQEFNIVSMAMERRLLLVA